MQKNLTKTVDRKYDLTAFLVFIKRPTKYIGLFRIIVLFIAFISYENSILDSN